MTNKKPKIECFFRKNQIDATPPTCYGSPAVCPSIVCSGCKWLDKGCPELVHAYSYGFEQGEFAERERLREWTKKNALAVGQRGYVAYEKQALEAQLKKKEAEK